MYLSLPLLYIRWYNTLINTTLCIGFYYGMYYGLYYRPWGARFSGFVNIWYGDHLCHVEFPVEFPVVYRVESFQNSVEYPVEIFVVFPVVFFVESAPQITRNRICRLIQFPEYSRKFSYLIPIFQLTNPASVSPPPSVYTLGGGLTESLADSLRERPCRAGSLMFSLLLAVRKKQLTFAWSLPMKRPIW